MNGCSKVKLVEIHHKEGVGYYEVPGNKDTYIVCDCCGKYLMDVEIDSHRKLLLYHNKTIEWQLNDGVDWVSVNEEEDVSTQYCCKCAEIQMVAPKL